MPQFRQKPQAHTKNYGIVKLHRHVIASQSTRMHLLALGFLMGNQIHGFGCPAFQTGTDAPKSI